MVYLFHTLSALKEKKMSDLQKKVSAFFAEMSTPANLKKIRREVEEKTQEVKRTYRGNPVETTRRGQSQFVLDGIHEILGDHPDCRNAEGPCLNVLVREHMNKKNAVKIIKALELLLPALYAKPNVLAQEFSAISKTIQNKFRETDIAEKAKKRLRLSKEASLLRHKNYQARVYQANVKQRELKDSEVLGIINKLSFEKDWVSLTVCVGLAVGSRLIEILLMSRYERAEENPHYIKVEGVAKGRGDERSITKPIVGGLRSDDIIAMVDEIRIQVSVAYDVDLGTGEGKRDLTRAELTGLADKKVNDKVREVFDPTYVFHDTRGIYAELAWMQYAPEGMSKTAFFANVLGHKEESLTTALSYQKFAVKRKLPEVSADIFSRVTTLEAQLTEVAKRAKTQRDEKKEEDDLWADTENQVTLLDMNGNPKTYRKQPRIRDKDSAARMQRLIDMVVKLKEDNVKTTHFHLRKLGFGGAVINKWSKGVVDEIE